MEVKGKLDTKIPQVEEDSIYKTIIQLARPFASILPCVKDPLKELNVQEKMLWTILAVLIFTIGSQIPLFGIVGDTNYEPGKWMKILLAANRGTIFDLGISPVITGSMIMNFLTSSGFIVFNSSIAEDKILSDAFQKIITLFVTVVQAFINVYTGYYGPLESIPSANKLIIFLQLFFAGIFMILLDEMLSKGYGYGNGVNLFIVSSACERLVWNAISPRVYHTARGLEFEGCLISLVYALYKKENKLSALVEVMFRENLPNIIQLLFTIFIFSSVVFLQQLKVEIPIFSYTTKGVNDIFPVSLLYTSTTPVILQNQICTNICAVSKLLYAFFPNYKIVRLLGVWKPSHKRFNSPISGICYFLTSPDSFSNCVEDPLQFVFYSLFTIISSAIISKNWTDSHSDSAKSVCARFKNNGINIRGVRDSNMFSVLEKNISVASVFSGCIISLIILFCDITSTYGSGSNVILAVSIIHQYVTSFSKDSFNASNSRYTLLTDPE